MTTERTPTIARMYDYYLGGTENLDVDREAADQVIAAVPDVVAGIRQNRAFLGRAVRFLAAEAGIRQFIDIGAGLPTQGNVHEIAHGVDPAARVVYVDFDPEVVAHAGALLAREPNAVAIEGDVRRPEELLAHPRLRELVDLDRPLAILMIAVVHFIPDAEDPAGVVGRYRDALPGGSYLALTHATADGIPADAASDAMDVYRSGVTPLYLRRRERVAAQLAGLTLVEPGLVNVAEWRPDASKPDDPKLMFYGAVGRR
ncbi:SAM-dependent methyltransferase [Micromonospora sp. PLK6-60]|uniref:SAM-dependent methyltransferase n=1 Tax=Micromonospora sp. PLK6-60 TaxID=2873383 RepID=UPI001CA69F39|nr:SAM-dependent methyltransferase [Micromonospora sp. PLK6-60]MBY8870737.1 SAM-dependent methyltransferase [Micromonospora sp. PLK6-60]